MSLTNLKDKKSQGGFTIVELLIVVVIIGILAAIVIVAYNGITNRAKTSKSQAAANTVVKKEEAFNAMTGAYPTAVVATTGFSTASPADVSVSLQGSGITLAAISAAPTNENTVEVLPCSSGGSGAKVGYWDFGAGSKTQINVGAGATCTLSATALSGGPY